jgi:MoaA/NifB/PqqE/SkfB family radical SAM enzyme
MRKICPDFLKPTAFQVLIYAYKASRNIEPLRRRILPPLKRANAWIAKHDRREGRSLARNYPVQATIQATWRCNLTCPMCFRQMWPEDVLADANTKEMPLEDFKKVAEEILPYAQTINLSVAGEPLLLTKLPEILEILGYYQCKLEIYSNITPLISDKLMDLVLPHVGILRASIDGATKKTFETIREGAKFEPVMRALERFGRLRAEMPDPKPRYGIHVTIQKDNVQELPDMVRLAARVKADFVSGDHLLILGPSTKALSVAHDQDTYRAAYEEACRVGKELGIGIELRPPVTQVVAGVPMGKRESLEELKKTGEVECPFLWDRVIINYNGHTLACCHPEPPEYAGNAIEGFWKVWNSPQAQTLRRTYLTNKAHPSCRNCHLLLKRDGTEVQSDDQFDMENFQEESKAEFERYAKNQT